MQQIIEPPKARCTVSDTGGAAGSLSCAPLQIKDLRKTYGGKTVLSIGEITLRSHSFTCIVGKSGCGKTTLLRVLAGLENADTGTITGLPDKTAPVFQEPRLMPWLTVKDNILLSEKARPDKKNPPALSGKERIEELLDDLELTEAAGLYPRQLSGGMAQRVSLGRTLYYDPELILMDEPFSSLDYFTRRHLQDMVLHIFRNKQKTILLVTHDVEEALLLGDRILVMEKGGIKADFAVPFTHPRKAADPVLQRMRQQILYLLA